MILIACLISLIVSFSSFSADSSTQNYEKIKKIRLKKVKKKKIIFDKENNDQIAAIEVINAEKNNLPSPYALLLSIHYAQLPLSQMSDDVVMKKNAMLCKMFSDNKEILEPFYSELNPGKVDLITNHEQTYNKVTYVKNKIASKVPNAADIAWWLSVDLCMINPFERNNDLSQALANSIEDDDLTSRSKLHKKVKELWEQRKEWETTNRQIIIERLEEQHLTKPSPSHLTNFASKMIKFYEMRGGFQAQSLLQEFFNLIHIKGQSRENFVISINEFNNNLKAINLRKLFKRYDFACYKKRRKPKFLRKEFSNCKILFFKKEQEPNIIDPSDFFRKLKIWNKERMSGLPESILIDGKDVYIYNKYGVSFDFLEEDERDSLRELYIYNIPAVINAALFGANLTKLILNSIGLEVIPAALCDCENLQFLSLQGNKLQKISHLRGLINLAIFLVDFNERLTLDLEELGMDFNEEHLISAHGIKEIIFYEGKKNLVNTKNCPCEIEGITTFLDKNYILDGENPLPCSYHELKIGTTSLRN